MIATTTTKIFALSLLLSGIDSLENSSITVPQDDVDIEILAGSVLAERRGIGGWAPPPQEQIEQELAGWFLSRQDSGPPYVLSLLAELVQEIILPTSDSWVFTLDPQELALLRWKLPIGFIIALRDAVFSAASGLEPTTEYPRLVVPAVDMPRHFLRSELADGHVHIGAAAPFLVVFMAAVDGFGRTERNWRESVGFRFGNKYFRPEVLLLATRVVLPLIWRFSLRLDRAMSFGTFVDGTGLSPDLAKTVKDRGFWPSVMAETRRNPKSDQPVRWIQSLTEAYEGENDLRLLVDQLEEKHQTADWEHLAFGLWNRLSYELVRNAGDRLFVEHLTQVVRCLFTLHGAVTTTYPGLEEFVRHHSRHSALRGLTGLDPDVLITQGLLHLQRSKRLRRIELRIPIQPRSSRDDRFRVSRLARDFEAYLKSYRALVLAGPDPALVMTMPISLSKGQDDNQPALEDSRIECKWNAAHLWATVGVLGDLLARCPQSSMFFGGIDVAGKEHALGNWMFLHLFRELAVRVDPGATGRRPDGTKLMFTFHAGEAFVTPLQGLRRVDDVLQINKSFAQDPENSFDVRISRIGHGLALSWTRDWHRGLLSETQPRQELLDDLVWAWENLGITGNSDLRLRTEAAIRTLSSECYGASIEPTVHARAMELRHARDVLIEIGLLNIRNPEAKKRFQVTENEASIFRYTLNTGTEERRLLAAFLTSKELDKPIRLSDYWDLIQSIAMELQPVVLKRVVETGVIIETCPTSNLVIAGLRTYVGHPIFQFVPSSLDRVLATINTDDPGLFHIGLEDEYAVIWNAAKEKIDLSNVTSRLGWIDEIRKIGMTSSCQAISISERADILTHIDACLEELSAIRRN